MMYDLQEYGFNDMTHLRAFLTQAQTHAQMQIYSPLHKINWAPAKDWLTPITLGGMSLNYCNRICREYTSLGYTALAFVPREKAYDIY